MALLDEAEPPWLIWQPVLGLRNQILLAWNVLKDFSLTNSHKEWAYWRI